MAHCGENPFLEALFLRVYSLCPLMCLRLTSAPVLENIRGVFYFDQRCFCRGRFMSLLSERLFQIQIVKTEYDGKSDLLFSPDSTKHFFWLWQRLLRPLIPLHHTHSELTQFFSEYFVSVAWFRCQFTHCLHDISM